MKREENRFIPVYPHHCRDCQYLGIGGSFEGQPVDVYYCQNQKEHVYQESIVARWSQVRSLHYPYDVGFLFRIDPESGQKNASLQIFLFGLDEAKKRGLIHALSK